jgi:cation diffusion facilitator CzcD-associated flavoprotein CzcO
MMIGFVNKWKFPDIPGIEDFQGRMMHTANWQHDVEYKGKRVAVIGNGSSGIQIVPNLQPHVEVLDHYVRGPTWISFGFGEGAAKRYNPHGGNGFPIFRTELTCKVKFTTEQIKAFTEDHETYMTFRKAIESEYIISLRI